MAYAQNVVSFLATLTLLSQILLLLALLETLWSWKAKRAGFLARISGSQGLLLMLIIACTATAGSLFFSEIAGWVPCKLCWFQRICMYPQTVILMLALWKKDQQAAFSILALSIIGMLFSLVHYHEQVLLALHPVSASNPLQPCDASGTSCATTQIHFLYGYITIPLMALTGFALNALLSTHLLRRKTIS